jgi:hypothetical protein
MSNAREDRMVRDLAQYAVDFSAHPDLDELHRRGQAIVSRADGKAADLAVLAANYTRDGVDAELERSAREVLAQPFEPMKPLSRRLIGVYLVTLGIAVVAVLPWAWSVASSVGPTTPEAHFMGFAFTPTTSFTRMLIITLVAIAGSVAIMSITFANRAGKHTLEDGWQWWYLTRPICAAVIGVVSYMAILAGYLDEATTDRSELIVAAAIGGLAGLFTDKVIELMRKIIGLTAFGTPTKPNT